MLIGNTYYLSRIVVAVPDDFRSAVLNAAATRGLNVSDFTRQALSHEMGRAGIAHPRLPALGRPTPQKRGAGR